MCIGSYWTSLILALLLLASCTSNRNKEKKLIIHDIDLKLSHEQEIDTKLSTLGIIDMTALSNKKILDNFNLKVARYDKNKDEIFSIVLLDKNGNGLHNDFNVDLIALAPNNWSELNGDRFWRLNFVPLKENHSIYIYNHFETIVAIGKSMIKTSLSSPTNDFITFPYTIPSLVKTTIDEDILNFSELTEQKKLIFFEFWGTWCKPCVEQIPDIKELVKKYNDKLIIIGISERDKIDKLKKFTTHFDMSWPQIQMDKQISKSFGEVTMFPLGILYDQNGKLISYGVKPKKIIKVLSKYD